VSAERRLTFRKLSWATLIATLAVIVWGAFVRATGSGAGCGSHWPLCNGEVVPRPKSVATVIELTHRLTSGVALLLTVALLIQAFRSFPARHSVRRAASASMFLMFTEAGVGAGLVLFEMVAGNQSAWRALWMSAHLINTFFLVAALSLTVWFAHDKPAPRVRGPRALAIIAMGLGLLAASVAGAVVALGDTLFPARSLAEGLAADVAPGAHFLIRLRALHPVVVIAVGTAIMFASRAIALRDSDPDVRRWSMYLNGAFALQVVIGTTNMLLLAPVALQLLHLLVADLYWIAAVIFSVSVLARPAPAPLTATGDARVPAPQ
jgi:heme a synthase